MTSSQAKIEKCSVETLRRLAETQSIRMSPEDEEQYLALLHGVQESVELIDQLPDFVDARLNPDLGDGGAASRTYTTPAASENPLNAWSHRTHIEASGRSTDGEGLLTGKTVAIKDHVFVAGIPLTGGTQPYHLCQDQPFPIPTVDAPVVSRILEAGAVIKGTSTCENYCMSANSCTSASGPVDNPWLFGRGRYSAGGSSSGSAALLAINVVKQWRSTRGLPALDLGEGVDFASGGDQGGSIRCPAAYCGIYGLKPTHGLVPYTGILGLLPMIDHCGPMATSVRDTALFLSVLAGYDGLDHRMTPETPLRENVSQYHVLLDKETESREAAGSWTATTAASGLRIGILKEGFEVRGTSDEVAEIVRKAADRFKSLGASVVEEVSVPLHVLGQQLFTAATYAYMADAFISGTPSTDLSFPFPAPPIPGPNQNWYDTMTKSNPVVTGALLGGLVLKDRKNYPESVRGKAIRHAHQLRAAYDEVLKRVDVLVLPTTPTVAPPHVGDDMGVAEKAAFLIGNTVNTMPFDVSGHPALAMPVGWARASSGREDDRLPVSMQIVGRRWDENKIFLAAAAWEVGGHGLDQE